MSAPTDVLIAGAGPAGLTLAAACAGRGLGVVCVAPDLGRPWPNNYGVWLDEVGALDLGDGAPHAVPYHHRWSTATVFTGDGPAHVLAREYGQIDRGGLQALLRERLERAGARLVEGALVGIDHEGAGSVARLDGGRSITARVVVDATGASTPFVARVGPSGGGQQVAYGCLYEVEAPPYPEDTMVLMDWRPACADGRLDTLVAPSFLYAMPQGPGRVFLQETSLLADPGASMELLRARLAARMERMGIHAREAGFVERCVIPMATALPRLDQRIFAYGAAAAMVHPATGYQVAQALRMAAPVAQTLADALGGGAGPADAVRRAWSTLWPADRRRARALYQMGADMLAAFTTADLATFFDAFFRLPPARWQAYLSGRSGPTALMASMFGLLPHLSWRLRAAAFQHGARSAWAALSDAPSATEESHEPR